MHNPSIWKDWLYTIKDWYAKYMKNSYNSITKHPIKNWGQAPIDIFPKKTSRWPRGLWKDIQHHQLFSQFSSVTQSCPTLCNPMNHSTPGLPVHHKLPEFAQTHAHWVCDAIQPSHPLSSPSPPATNSSQHQGLFQRVNSSHKVFKVLEFRLLRKLKSKPQRAVTFCCKVREITNAGEDMEKGEFSYTVGGNVNWYSIKVATIKNCMEIPPKCKNRATIGPSYFTSEYLPKENKSTNLKTYALLCSL